MMMISAKAKPRLLDLCCRAGGASMGYVQAGFEVVGVDILPQRHYPFEFHQADAFEYAENHWREFDAIHVSPHCQAYSLMRHVTKKEYPRQIEQFREMLLIFGLPYVIENVEKSPLPALPLFGPTQFSCVGRCFPACACIAIVGLKAIWLWFNRTIRRIGFAVQSREGPPKKVNL